MILKQIVSLAKHVRIFLTSRSDGDMQKILSDFPSHYLDAVDNIGDIKTYIKSEIEQRFSSERWWNADPALRSEIISTLEKGACGMYVFSVCILSILAKIILGSCGYIYRSWQLAESTRLGT